MTPYQQRLDELKQQVYDRLIDDEVFAGPDGRPALLVDDVVPIAVDLMTDGDNYLETVARLREALADLVAAVDHTIAVASGTAPLLIPTERVAELGQAAGHARIVLADIDPPRR